MSKKKLATVTAKGFKKGEKGRISHKTTTLYTDKDAFLAGSCDDDIIDMLNAFSMGITAVMENKKIKPGSLRITWVYEK